MALCLAAGGLVTRLALTTFTLAWLHSVEKVRWEEDWRVEGPALVITEARILGSGAGMEPPEDAVLADGAWHYRPNLGPLARIDLARSGVVPDWQLCSAGRCREIADYLPGRPREGTVTLSACRP